MHRQKDVVPADAVMDPQAEHRLAPVVAGQDLASAVIQDTVKYLGIQATGISDLKGPYLQVRPAGNNATDIMLVGSWRAHFPPGGDRSGPILDSLQPALPKPAQLTVLAQTAGSDGALSIQAAPSKAPVAHSNMLTTAGAAAAEAASGPGGVELGKPQRPVITSLRGRLPPTDAVMELQNVRVKQRGPIVEECHSDSEAAMPQDHAGSLSRHHQHRHSHHVRHHRHHYCRRPDRSEHSRQKTDVPMAQLDASAASEAVDSDRVLEDVAALQQGRPVEGEVKLLLNAVNEPEYGASGVLKEASCRNGHQATLEGPGLAMAGALASVGAVQAAAANTTLLTPVAPSAGPLVVCPRPRSEWELDPAKISVGRRLAVGGFGEVFLAKYEGTLVAVKRLLATDSDTAQRFLDEVHMLARLRHPNLLLFMGYTLMPEPSIVTEFMARGSLFHILRHAGSRPPDLRMQRAVAVAVARGMAYLHSRMPPILHLDLKSPNVLVDDRWRVKIADFGLSRVRQRTYVSSGAAAGSPEWMAPEVLRCDHFAEAADVYSYGVILWELLTGQAPWADLNAMQVVGAVGFARRSLPDPMEGDAVLRHLCKLCRAYEPAQRPTFAQVVESLESSFNPFTAPVVNTAAAVGAAGEALAARPGAALPVPALPAPEPVAAAAAAAHPAECIHLPSAPSAGGDAADVEGRHGAASAALAVATTASVATRINRHHSLAASHDAAEVLAPAGAADAAHSGGGVGVGWGESLSSGGGPPRLDARFSSLHESPRSRRRYRSPRGEEMVGPPAITARLQDGRKTPSPRTSSGWTCQGGSDGTGGAKANAAAAGPMPAAQLQQPAAAGCVRLMHASTSPFAAMATADFGPDSARSLRKLRLDAIRSAATGSDAGGSTDGGVRGDGSCEGNTTAEPQSRDVGSPEALTLPSPLVIVGTSGVQQQQTDQWYDVVAEMPPSSRPPDADDVDAKPEAAATAAQHSSQPDSELEGLPKGQLQDISQHCHPQEVSPHKHEDQAQALGDRNQALWQGEPHLHRQTEQQQAHPPMALVRRSQKVQQQQEPQQLQEQHQRQPEQIVGNGPLTQHWLSGCVSRRPGHRRVNSDEANVSAVTGVSGASAAAGGAPQHAQHPQSQQRLLGTGASAGGSAAGAVVPGGSGMPPLPGRRTRGLSRNSAPMRYTYGGSSSGVAAAQQLHYQLQSPPRPRLNMHQQLLTANEVVMAVAAQGQHPQAFSGASTPATPGGGNGTMSGAAAILAPMSLSPASDGGLPFLDGAGGPRSAVTVGELRERDVLAVGSCGGAGGAGAGGDPWPDTHSELSFAFILRDNVSICSDDYMQSASLDRLPLLEESEMMEAAGEDSDGIAEGGPSASLEEVDDEGKEGPAAGGLGSAGANPDREFELPCPFLNVSQPIIPQSCRVEPLSPFAVECVRPPWGPCVTAHDNNQPAAEAELWPALRAHSSTALEHHALADCHPSSQAYNAPASPLRTHRGSSGDGGISQDGGDGQTASIERGMQSEGTLPHPWRLQGDGSREAGTQAQAQPKGDGDQTTGKPRARMPNGNGVTTYRTGRFKVTIEPACSEPPPLQHASLPQANQHLQQHLPNCEGQQLQHFLSLPQAPSASAVTMPAAFGSSAVMSSGTAEVADPALGRAAGAMLDNGNSTVGQQPLLQSCSACDFSLAAPLSAAAVRTMHEAVNVPQPLQTGLTSQTCNGPIFASGAGRGGSSNDGGASPQATVGLLSESSPGCTSTGRQRNGHHGHHVHSHNLHGELASVALNSVTMYRKGRFFVSHAAAGTHSLSVTNPNVAPAQTQSQAAAAAGCCGCGGGRGSVSNGAWVAGGCCTTESSAEDSEEHDAAASGPTSPFACIAAAAGHFGLSGSQYGMDGGVPQGLAAKPSWPVLATLAAAHDDGRLSPISRQYSKGRFTVAESIVAAPLAELRRPSSNSLGGDASAKAADLVWEPKPSCMTAVAAGVSAALQHPDSLTGPPITANPGAVDDSFAKPQASMPTFARVASLQTTQLQALVSGGNAACGLASAAVPLPDLCVDADTCGVGGGGGGGCSGGGGAGSAPSTAPTSPRPEQFVVRRVGRFTVREVEGGSSASSRDPSSSGTPVDPVRIALNTAGAQTAAGILPGIAVSNGAGGCSDCGAARHRHINGSPQEELMTLSSRHSSSSFASASGCSRSSSESQGLDLLQPPLTSTVPLVQDACAAATGHQPSQRSLQGQQQRGAEAAAAPQPQPAGATEADVLRSADPRALRILRVKSKGRFTVIDYEAPSRQQEQRQQQPLGSSWFAVAKQQPGDEACVALGPSAEQALPSSLHHITFASAGLAGTGGGEPSLSSGQEGLPVGPQWPAGLASELARKPARQGTAAEPPDSQVQTNAGRVAEGVRLPHGGILHPPPQIPSTGPSEPSADVPGAETQAATAAPELNVLGLWGMSGTQAPEQRAQLQADMERLVRERMDRNALEQQQQQRWRWQESVQRSRRRLARPLVGQSEAQQQQQRAGRDQQGDDPDENGLDDRCTYRVSFGDGLTIRISHGLVEGNGRMREEVDERDDEDALMVDVGIVHREGGDGVESDSEDVGAEPRDGDRDGADSDNELQPLQPPDTPAHEPAHERERDAWTADGNDGSRQQRRQCRHRGGGYLSGDSSDYEDSMEF